MDANKNPSYYEEALLRILELERIVECQRAIIKTDDALIAKYEELIDLYKKELGE